MCTDLCLAAGLCAEAVECVVYLCTYTCTFISQIRCKVRVGAMSGNHHESDRSEN